MLGHRNFFKISRTSLRSAGVNMSWLGKVVGGAVGLLTGGPLGAIVGATLGHQLDKGADAQRSNTESDYPPGSQQRVQMAFFTATFSVMGHIAKADGRVSEAEIAMARAIMNKMELTESMRQTAMRLFNEGKQTQFPLDQALEHFRHECHRRSSLIRMFIEIQLQAAFADGALHTIEEQMLLHVCDKLRFPRFEFQTMRALLEAQMRFSGSDYSAYSRSSRSGGERGERSSPPPARPRNNLADAYAVLGISSAATEADVKKAYRRLMSQNHPDKLVAKGLPEDMVKLATEKTQQIRKAYDLICENRGIKH